MPESITINTGVIQLLINGGPTFIEFNPDDVIFAEKFYKLMQNFKVKKDEYKKRADLLEIQAKKNAHAKGEEPTANISENIELIRDMCDFTASEIDALFGEGTCQKVFNGTKSLPAYEQFFTGITPYIKSSREAKIHKYTTVPTQSKKRKRVIMQ